MVTASLDHNTEQAMKILLSALPILLLTSAPCALGADRSAKELCGELIVNYAYFSDTAQREKFGELFTHEGVLITGGAR